jgi:hypothetical protein
MREVVAVCALGGRIHASVEDIILGSPVLPSISTYARRAVPGQPAVSLPQRHDPPAPLVAESLVPCAVDAIAVINAERRLLLPPSMRAKAIVLRALDAAIELRAGEDDERTIRPDHRRRLRLPQGVVRAAGLRPCMRVALLRTGPDRWEVVDARRLGLRKSA